MTHKAIALATAAMISLAAVAPATAMENEHKMLVGAIFNEVKRLGLETTNIDKLTLNEVARIKNVTSGDSMSEQQQKNEVRKILTDAGERG
ncbi:MAG: hypothetical protein AAFU56_10685 [Pseudomonadota bacterium]